MGLVSGDTGILFNRKLARPAIFGNGLVYPSICPAADEPDNMVFIAYAHFTGVSRAGRSSRIQALYSVPSQFLTEQTGWQIHGLTTIKPPKGVERREIPSKHRILYLYPYLSGYPVPRLAGQGEQ